MKMRLFLAIPVAAVLILAALLYRHPTAINYEGQAIEYSPIDGSISVSHEVVIKGTYYSAILGQDSFYGTFFVSDIKGVGENENNASFNFDPRYRYRPAFLNACGEPVGSQIAHILFDKDFRRLAIQLTTEYFIDDEGILHTEANDTASHFLVVDAAERETALSQYSSMLKEKRFQ